MVFPSMNKSSDLSSPAISRKKLLNRVMHKAKLDTRPELFPAIRIFQTH